MSNGRIFMPMSDHGFHFDGEKYVFNSRGISKFLYSDDGITFNEDVQALEFPDINDKNGLQEPGIIELPNGTLYGYFRTDADYQYESFSYDNGITWTQVQPSKFESPLSPMSITKNPYSNKYYAIYNPFKDRPESIEHPRFRNTWGRTPLAIAESDDGINFSDFALIESDLKCGYCYPAIFYLSDKEALISYCSGGGDITTLQRTTISKIYFE